MGGEASEPMGIVPTLSNPPLPDLDHVCHSHHKAMLPRAAPLHCCHELLLQEVFDIRAKVLRVEQKLFRKLHLRAPSGRGVRVLSQLTCICVERIISAFFCERASA